MTRTRMPPSERREEILLAAVALAHKDHYKMLSLRGVAAAAGVSHPLVLHYFGSRHKLESAVLKHAWTWGPQRILAQAIVAGDPRVRFIPKAEKERIVSSL